MTNHANETCDDFTNLRIIGFENEAMAKEAANELRENWFLFLVFMLEIDTEYNTDLFKIFMQANEVALNFKVNKEKQTVRLSLTIDLGEDLKPVKEKLNKFIEEHFEAIAIKMPYQEIKLEFMGKYQDKTKFSFHNL